MSQFWENGVTEGLMDGQLSREQFIRPSSRAEGPKRDFDAVIFLWILQNFSE